MIETVLLNNTIIKECFALSKLQIKKFFFKSLIVKSQSPSESLNNPVQVIKYARMDGLLNKMYSFVNLEKKNPLEKRKIYLITL